MWRLIEGRGRSGHHPTTAVQFTTLPLPRAQPALAHAGKRRLFGAARTERVERYNFNTACFGSETGRLFGSHVQRQRVVTHGIPRQTVDSDRLHLNFDLDRKSSVECQFTRVFENAQQQRGLDSMVDIVSYVGLQHTRFCRPIRATTIHKRLRKLADFRDVKMRFERATIGELEHDKFVSVFVELGLEFQQVHDVSPRERNEQASTHAVSVHPAVSFRWPTLGWYISGLPLQQSSIRYDNKSLTDSISSE